MSSERTGHGPLAELSIVECSPSESGDATRAAVAFAGLLAARFGAEVRVIEPEGGDPMRHWPPCDETGSLLHAFLTRDKRIAGPEAPPPGAVLLTDSPERAANWPDERVVLVTAAPDADTVATDELMIMARSGLLDIFGDSGGPPRPLPGHQVAFMGGLAAFNALLTSHLLEARGGRPAAGRVTLLDAALWVNWKHFLAGWQDNSDAGLRRLEEWTTLRCRDGHVALTFQDKDMGNLAVLCGNEWFRSPELATRRQRVRHIARITEALEDWTRQHDRGEITRRAKELRLPVGPVLTPSEVVNDRHLDARAFFHATGGGRVVPRLPVLWNGRIVEKTLRQLEERPA